MVASLIGLAIPAYKWLEDDDLDNLNEGVLDQLGLSLVKVPGEVPGEVHGQVPSKVPGKVCYQLDQPGLGNLFAVWSQTSLTVSCRAAYLVQVGIEEQVQWGSGAVGQWSSGAVAQGYLVGAGDGLEVGGDTEWWPGWWPD